MKRLLKLPILAAILAATAFGQSDFVNDSDLGNLGFGSLADAARNYLISRESGNLAANNADYVAVDAFEDGIGLSHVRFQPVLNGYPVAGAHVLVHAVTVNREVTGVDNEIKIPANLSIEPSLEALTAANLILKSIAAKGAKLEGAPELMYVVNDQRLPVLSWAGLVSYVDGEGPQLDRVFINADNGATEARHPLYHYARNRRTYDANNGSSLPGTLRRTEGQGAYGDVCLDAAHDYAGDTYDYYWTEHGRDSYNGSGATLTSSVHYQVNLNNAYWDGSQMLYGDGDGVDFICLARSREVVSHELTHAVTESTANLIYQNESGALNEAMSDILGVSVDAWKNGGVSAATWKLGEDVFTPGTSGDALRYMNNPTLDGISYDYYPERYTGSADNGGVHLNSGIANLAFYLLVQGGTHPRGKTATVVTGIGIDDAAAIFYRALTTYMGPSTNFSGARSNTVQAASDLFGSSSVQATQIANAWTAVGVSGPQPPTPINNGQTISGISASTGTWQYYTISVPSGATNLVISISGGSGDCDLYTRFASQPTTSSYNCRPYANGNSESCTEPNPSAGTWHIGLNAYSTFSGVSLTASYTGAASNQAPNASFSSSVNNLTASFTDTSTDPDGTIASRAWTFGDGGTATTANPSHTYASAGTYTVTLTVTDDDGATDSASSSVTVTAPPSGPTELSNGQTVTGLSAATGQWEYFFINVPTGATNLVISISGGSGDADLYTRLGSQPTTSTYNCRPYKSGNSESCTEAAPAAGNWYIGVRAYSAYAGVTLTASFTAPSGGGDDPVGGGTVSSISGATGSWNHYYVDLPSGMTRLEASISGGTGDADMYVRFNAQPTTSSWDYRPYLSGNNESVTVNNPAAGRWYVSIRAYSTYSGVTMEAYYYNN